MRVEIKRLPHGENLPLPYYATEGAAAMDVVAAETVTIPARHFAMVPLGFCLAIPEGYEIQARSRSGLAVKHGVVVLHGVGTIDSDYRGELFYPLMNHTDEDYTVDRGDRIGQLVLAKVEHADLDLQLELSETVRGQGGFGSTGR
jgi:dUTP pyrophosphatase